MTDIFFKYSSMKALESFEDLSLDENYHEVPRDWNVLISDIVGSTKAIQDGRYKEVNFVGASTIGALLEYFKVDEVPCVFGGDGAMFLLPSESLPGVTVLLKKLRGMAFERFGFELRMGIVKVAELYADGFKLGMARLALNENVAMAMFKGNGYQQAEKLIKSDSEYQISEMFFEPVSLGGLSCRWEPLAPSHGHVLSAIISFSTRVEQGTMQTLDGIHHLQSANETLVHILKRLENIGGQNLLQRNPAIHKNLRGNYSKAGIQLEAQGFSQIFIWLQCIFVKLWIFLGLRFSLFNGGKYIEEMTQQSDFKKFDDQLRFVIDCSEKEIRIVEEFLNCLRNKGLINFGLHVSKNALMTCLVTNISHGKHLHYIDGSDGGYALAAKQLKANSSAPLARTA